VDSLSTRRNKLASCNVVVAGVNKEDAACLLVFYTRECAGTGIGLHAISCKVSPFLFLSVICPFKAIFGTRNFFWFLCFPVKLN
jgi:hypothetical protein